METKKLTKEQEEAKRALLTGHFPYMMQALAIAYQRVPAWRFAENGTPCSVLDVFKSAKKYDEEHPRKEDDRSFFYVSLEGAIGYCPTGVEFQVVWLFYPMEPGEERNSLVKAVKEEYDRVEAQLEAEKKAAEEAAAAPAKHVCPHCGATLSNPNAKFCGNCGKPLK